MEFKTDASAINTIEFRPYMIETAYDYYSLAKKSRHHRMSLQCVISALSVEVSLKSFNSIITANPGKPNENYKFNTSVLPSRTDAHDLVNLANALPTAVYKYLLAQEDIITIESNRDLFKKSRYAYEREANSSHSDDIIKLAAKLICKIIFLYQQKGCTDSFISSFDTSELYFNDVQRFLFSPSE